LGAWLCLSSVLFVCFLGCSSGKKALSEVKGKVTFNGAPLPGGIVFFAPESKPTFPIATSGVGTEGEYRLSCEPGPVVATVEGPTASSNQDDKDQPPPVVLPSKYQNPALSGLKFTIVEGQQEINIDLKQP